MATTRRMRSSPVGDDRLVSPRELPDMRRRGLLFSSHADPASEFRCMASLPRFASEVRFMAIRDRNVQREARQPALRLASPVRRLGSRCFDGSSSGDRVEASRRDEEIAAEELEGRTVITWL